MIGVLDTETSGLKHSHGDRAFAIGYTDDNEDEHVVYIGLDNLAPVDAIVLRSDTQWVGHNIGFDLPMLADFQILPKVIHDTLIAAHVYNNLEPAKDLASLATKYCGIGNEEDKVLDQWFEDNGYNDDNRKYIEVPQEIMTPYAKADLRRTLALFKFYLSKGVIDDPAYKLEMELVPIVAKIQARGMRVDVEFARKEFDAAIKILAAMELRALNEFGVENIGSSQQIAEALFTRGGLKCTTFTEKGNIQLDETSISKYDHPLVDLVLSYRQLGKLTNTYLKAIIEKSYNGRLHSSLKQVGARTGRFASAEPNLTNLPRYNEQSPINIRKAFICSEEFKLLFIDLSQIELRVLAHYSKEPEMIRVLSDRTGDLHGATSQLIFGIVDKKHRTVAKTLNFATIYSAGKQKLCNSLNIALPGSKFTVVQTQEFKTAYFNGFPRVQQLIWGIKNRINERGYIQDIYNKKYYCEKESAYRGLNYLCQGCSAMILKEIIIGVEALLSDKKSRLIMTVHDELVIELHNTEESLIPIILSIVESSKKFRVPIYAGVSISNTNWYEKEDISYERIMEKYS